jgi:hypothetical protein
VSGVPVTASGKPDKRALLGNAPRSMQGARA